MKIMVTFMFYTEDNVDIFTDVNNAFLTLRKYKRVIYRIFYI